MPICSSIQKSNCDTIALIRKKTLCACPSYPTMSVITVNRVQDVFKNRIYEDTNNVECHIMKLNDYMLENRNIDLDHYRKSLFTSVHVGDLVLTSETLKGNEGKKIDSKISKAKVSATPMLTVIMPVYNGAKYLREAMDSILNQTYKDFEFIVIDDASTDDTSDIFFPYLFRQLDVWKIISPHV